MGATVKTAAFVFVLSVLSFGQIVSDAQRQACADTQNAVIAKYSDPKLSEKDLRKLFVNLQQTCGTPNDTEPIADIHKVVTECARTLIRSHNADLTKLSMDEFHALLDSVAHDCRTHPVAHDVTLHKMRVRHLKVKPQSQRHLTYTNFLLKVALL
jgi:hypothetical protein